MPDRGFPDEVGQATADAGETRHSNTWAVHGQGFARRNSRTLELPTIIKMLLTHLLDTLRERPVDAPDRPLAVDPALAGRVPAKNSWSNLHLRW
jgi:hypothetical protein